MRRPAIFLFVPMLFLSACGSEACGGIIYNGKKVTEIQAFMEYALIFQQLIAKDRSIPELIQKTYPKIIREYESFIRKYPESHLVDDAKLRIAEFYNLMGTAEKEDILKRRFDFDRDWLAKANHWLRNIVINHPDSKMFELYPPAKKVDLIDGMYTYVNPSPINTDEYTAAYALYWLWAWNKNKSAKLFYKNLLLKRYPGSKPTLWVK